MDAKSSRERQPGEVNAFLAEQQRIAESWSDQERAQFMAAQRERLRDVPRDPAPPAQAVPGVHRAGSWISSSHQDTGFDTSLYGIVATLGTDCGCHC